MARVLFLFAISAAGVSEIKISTKKKAMKQWRQEKGVKLRTKNTQKKPPEARLRESCVSHTLSHGSFSFQVRLVLLFSAVVPRTPSHSLALTFYLIFQRQTSLSYRSSFTLCKFAFAFALSLLLSAFASSPPHSSLFLTTYCPLKNTSLQAFSLCNWNNFSSYLASEAIRATH